MFGRSFHLFSVLGIPIKVDVSWFIVVVLMTYGLFSEYSGDPAMRGVPASHAMIMGVVGALSLFGSVLLHELGHSAVAIRNGLRIRGITLFFLGGVAEMADDSPRPSVEFLVAVAGPMVSAVLAGVFHGVAFLEAGGTVALPVELLLVVQTLAFVNTMLVVFNMLPGFPMDGGRVFRSVLWALSKRRVWATVWAGRVGMGFGSLFMIGGVATLLGVTQEALSLVSDVEINPAGGLSFLLIGMFLRYAARSGILGTVLKDTLEGLPISRVMRRGADTAHPDDTLEGFLLQHGYESERRCCPVVDGDLLEGILLGDLVDLVPPRLRGTTRVSDIMDENLVRWLIHPGVDALEAYIHMARGGQRRFIVALNGEALGVLALEDLEALVQARIRGA